MNAKAETQSVTLEFDLPQAPAKVWRALTEPALLAWRGGGIDTVVIGSLAPTAKGGTLLRLEQSGFRLDQGEARFLEGAKMGWQNMAGQRLPEVLGQIP